MDFRRLTSDDRWIYTYRCDKCGYQNGYIIELPLHLRQCASGLHLYRKNRCVGQMMFVSVKGDEGNTSDRLPELRHEEPIEDLIERSSLGSPGAKELRESVPKEVVEKVLRRVDELSKERSKMRKLGSYKARAVSSVLGVAGTGTEQVAVTFEITADGPRKGEQHVWYGFFTDATTSRTLESLETAGWDGDSLDKPVGLGRIECEVVLGEEEYNGDMKVRVQWVNRPGGGGVKNIMTPDEAKSFNERMRGEIAARKAERSQRQTTGDNSNFNYGANVPDKPPV